MKSSKRWKPKQYEAVVFDPYWNVKGVKWENLEHPLKKGELVYYLGEIPNVEGHCIVATYDGRVVPMIHPEDLRKAREDEL